MTRTVERIVRGMETQDGAGVRLKRIIGGPDLKDLDPFLLLDEFKSDQPDDYIAGFPDHPHRGFETVTIMLAGSMEHRDHAGNKGLLGPGSVQWMTAGRGIVHSEMPRQENGLMWGFQLWVNLPAKEKMRAPRYQDIPAERVVGRKQDDGAVVRVIAGSSEGVEGAVKGIVTDPLALDIRLPAGASVEQPVLPGHHAFAYVYEGALTVGGTRVEAGCLAVLADGDGVELRDGPGRVLLVAARPLGEPVARWGPFVMNTREEIDTAVRQFREGTFLG